nr:hypothetical protein [uncultured Draconibacterium sp.]
MQRIIEKHITDKKIKDRQKLIEDFVAAGFTITNAENIEFVEYHNFTTHSGKNKMMLFSPLLKGNLSLDFKDDVIKWYLNVDSLIVKASLTFVLITLLTQFLVLDIWINSIIFGAVVGGIIFSINWLAMDGRIDGITKNIVIE